MIGFQQCHHLSGLKVVLGFRTWRSHWFRQEEPQSFYAYSFYLENLINALGEIFILSNQPFDCLVNIIYVRLSSGWIPTFENQRKAIGESFI